MDRGSASDVLMNALSRVDRGVQVELHDTSKGVNDVFRAVLVKGDDPSGGAAVSEVGRAYGAATGLEGVVTTEAIQRAADDPAWVDGALQELVSLMRGSQGNHVFWQLTTEGLSYRDLGKGILGLSDEFFEQLADEAAIVEGRKEFRDWLVRARLAAD